MELLPFDRCEKIRLAADVQHLGRCFEFVFDIRGNTHDVIVPTAMSGPSPERLWSSTCFHAFVSLGARRYIEFDFSPSGKSSAHLFNEYRSGMQRIELPPAEVQFLDGTLVARRQLPSDVRSGAALGLAASIEHQNGTWSYWALAHVQSNRPDFHSRDCFVTQLP